MKNVGQYVSRRSFKLVQNIVTVFLKVTNITNRVDNNVKYDVFFQVELIQSYFYWVFMSLICLVHLEW